MTFSLVGRCERTGMFGVVITTSSICVGARCPHARAGVGAVATQNVTNPALGPDILDHLASGLGAQAALDKAMAAEKFADFRQVTVVDAKGACAHFTGKNILGTHALKVGDNCVGAGNLLKTTVVAEDLVQSFAANAGLHLGERLLKAIKAGQDAGGEEGPVHSAALLVMDKARFPLVDLRVDWDETDPIAALKRLWNDYEPQMQAYLDRAINPTAAPSYGVPGDQ